MTTLAVTVLGHDRPGIIAQTTAALGELGLNLEDSTMTLLRGHFAFMLICSGDAPADAVTQALQPLAHDGTLEVSVREVQVEPDHAGGGAPHQLVVRGGDRPGIVAALTAVIAEAGGNVTDLSTRLSGDLYVLVAEVDMPVDVDVDRLARRLDVVAGELGVGASLRPVDTDLL
jgi:glycine cleavage system transcriptional repressor